MTLLLLNLSASAMLLTLLYAAFFILLLYLLVFLINEIRQIARNSKRDVATWTILSIVFSPFIITVILTCLELCSAINNSKKAAEEKEKQTPQMLND